MLFLVLLLFFVCAKLLTWSAIFREDRSWWLFPKMFPWWAWACEGCFFFLQHNRFRLGLDRQKPNNGILPVCPVCPWWTPDSQQGSNWNGRWKASQADWVKLIILSRHNESISSAQQLSISTVATHLIQLNFTQALCKGWQPWCAAVSFKQINLHSGETLYAYLGQCLFDSFIPRSKSLNNNMIQVTSTNYAFHIQKKKTFSGSYEPIGTNRANYKTYILGFWLVMCLYIYKSLVFYLFRDSGSEL